MEKTIESQSKTHVLMVTLPKQGHINPMLKFAKHLSPTNLHITLATTEQAKTLFSAAGSSSGDNSVELAFFSDGLSEDDPRTDKSLVESLKVVGKENLSKIIEKNRFSCVISSPFTPWVPSVAASHNIPCAMLWIQACGAFSVYYRCLKKIDTFPEFDDLEKTVKLPALPLLKVKELPSFLLPSTEAHFRTLMVDFVECLKDVKWVLVNSFYELESEIVDSMTDLKPVITIGPMVSQFLSKSEDSEANLDMWKSEDSCIEWLEKQEKASVVYISFGSLLTLTESQIVSIATALSNRNVNFLWVIRPKERSENVAVLAEMVKKGKGVVIEWGPQEKILSNSAISCFITHCGWNSTLETVAAGVPVVAYPSWTDQPIDARLLCDVFGIGVQMRDEDGELKVGEVERCLEEVMVGQEAAEMKRRAVELKNAARKAMEGGGSSAMNLEKFVSDITSA